MNNKIRICFKLMICAIVATSCSVSDKAPTDNAEPMVEEKVENTSNGTEKAPDTGSNNLNGTKFNIYETDYTFIGPEMPNFRISNTQQFHQTDDCYYVWTYMFDSAESYEDGWNQARDSFLSNFSDYGDNLKYSFDSGERVEINGVEFTKFSGDITGTIELTASDVTYYTYGYYYYIDGIPGLFQVIDLSNTSDSSNHDEMDAVIDAMVSSVQKD